jgi:hypothetical protein
MMYCPNSDCPDAKRSGIPGQYRQDINECPKCGHALVHSKPAWAEVEEIEQGEMVPEYTGFVPVCSLNDVSMIPLVTSILQSANIRFFIKNEKDQTYYGSGSLGVGHNPIAGPPVVMVDPAGAEEASELLYDINTARNDD